ncbi:LOW QUALITY PROTEIN: C-X-C motif chemokine 17 [Budorcas taxicolor]|uniref:LOW QUALITY PROTEIN: C-X-C motif chemokine 17 n=1 Tax=Budorcas taxicolor TaxID=37181 RepID=UPI00228523E8|nr:LOW QUALITY PROTEIN: C-X-C motif chemokine 17 [Budorcas taxicolor]
MDGPTDCHLQSECLEVTRFPPTGVARGQRDQASQASGRWLQEGGQECECKISPFSFHQRHHRKPTKPSRACQRFLRQCQLASFALPL